MAVLGSGEIYEMSVTNVNNMMGDGYSVKLVGKSLIGVDGRLSHGDGRRLTTAQTRALN